MDDHMNSGIFSKNDLFGKLSKSLSLCVATAASLPRPQTSCPVPPLHPELFVYSDADSEMH